MNLKIFLKILASAIFLAYALWKLLPLQTTPFETYVETRATATDPALQDDYKKLLTEAKERVTAYADDKKREDEKLQPKFADNQKSPTLYAAIRDIGEGRGDPKGFSAGKPVDLHRFYPDINLIRDPNIPRRNNFILQELLRQSQGKLKLGLDLQGGVSFTLRIDPKNFVKAEDREAVLTKALREARRDLTDPETAGLTPAQKADAQAKWDAAKTRADEIAAKNIAELKDAAEKRLREGLERAITVMEGRVNAFGVAEPLIRVIGSDSIEIQLPGADIANNPEAINTLKKPAKLEFRLVHRYERDIPAGTPEGTTKRMRENPSDPNSPNDIYELLYSRHEVTYGEAGKEHFVNNKAGDIVMTPHYVKKNAAAAGNIVKEARPTSRDGGFSYETSIAFTSEGAKIFEKLTGEIAERNNELIGTKFERGAMAIVLDGKLVQAPGIRESGTGKNKYRAIAGGNATIEANSLKDATELANVLNNPLEFELELQESRQVGASLAQDAQTRSVEASLVGVALVIVFMVLYYLWAGTVSVLGLILNVVLLLGGMAAFGATITLPGVAALVLTIGMAVDANILVFERVREEMAEGKPVKVALKNGYDLAQATIIDANLTTLMSALILIFMGTGPVKGFGVILSIGILTTVFTVLITCRAIQELFVNWGIHLPIFGINIFKGNTKFQFLKYAKASFIGSWAILIVCIGALLAKGQDAFSKDFKGGEAAVVRVAEGQAPKDIGELVSAVTAAGVHDVTITYQSSLGGGKEVTLRVETELSANVNTPDGKKLADFTQVNKAVEAIRAKFPDHFPRGDLDKDKIVLNRESVGGAVSGSLQKNAVLSMLLALLGIAIYVALRYEPGMGLGAFVSSLHDVLLTSGLYILVGNQFSVTMIAAILMVIGYSINDTIVVFDRIREEMKRHPGMGLADVIHLSINKTLSRTLLTSLTVFLCAVALWQLGAGDVKDYGLIFVFGVITGTFSSIYIASPIFYWWHKGQRGSVERAEAQVHYEWEAGSEVKPKRRERLADEVSEA